jgi:hypothetical protein
MKRKCETKGGNRQGKNKKNEKNLSGKKDLKS